MLVEYPRFELLKDCYHEVLVHKIIPFVVCVLNLDLFIANVFAFTSLVNFSWEIKEFSKSVQELSEEKITIDLSLNLDRQLFDEFLVFLCANRLIFIVDPSIVKISFDLVFHLKWNRSSIIESLYESQPL